MQKFAHLTQYPDQIIVGHTYKKPAWFEKFDPEIISFSTVCDHDTYLESLTFAMDLMMTWKTTEDATMKKLNQDLSEQAFINYLDTVALEFFITPTGMEQFQRIITKEFSSFLINRFIELAAQLKVFLNPIAVQAMQGRMMHYLLTSNIEFAVSSLCIPVHRDGKLTLIVQNTPLYDLVKTYPWLWLIPLYRTFDTYVNMMKLKAPKITTA